MNEPDRRDTPAVRTGARKQFVAQLIMLAGVVLGLPGAFLVNHPGVSQPLLHLLTGLGLGLVLVGAVALVAIRMSPR